MIDLKSPLTFKNVFLFPLQTELGRKELLLGAAWLLVPGLGWIANMGHRIVMVNNMQRGLSPWPAWNKPANLLKHGAITFLGMTAYCFPSAALFAAGLIWNKHLLWPAGLLFLLAIITIPGFMSHYSRSLDPREIFNPSRALRRCLEGGIGYWKSWAIALSALCISFLGALFLGIGFLITSVWFWQAAGYSFANTISKTHQLLRPPQDPLKTKKKENS